MDLIHRNRFLSYAVAIAVVLGALAAQLVFANSANATNGDDDDDVKVTVVKYVNGSTASAGAVDSAQFPISALVTSPAGATSTSEYMLEASSSVPYKHVTDDMPEGTDYTLREVIDGSTVGGSCADGKPFALTGYTTGSTLAQAVAGTMTMTAPSFVDLMFDKYVIVWNATCNGSSSGTGSIGGDVTGGASNHGTLAVTSIDSVDTSAVADGTFESGLKYVFHITVPDNETNLAMKFADWDNVSASSTIPVANNMRISSSQADNGGATILLTAADTYSSPALHMTSDLDAGLPGLQVEVLVEVAVPSSTVNGSYTTSYGVQTLP